MQQILEISRDMKVEMGKMSNSELNDLINFAQELKTFNSKTSLVVGAKVWVVQKTKKTEGVVTKVKRTKCLVDMRGSSYSVPMSILEVR